MKGKYFITILLFSFIKASGEDMNASISFIKASGEEMCDSICKHRIQQFLTQQMSPLINIIGQPLNLTFPISGTLDQQVQMYQSIITLFSLLFGMNDSTLTKPLDLKLDITTQVETIKARAAIIYAALAQKSPNQAFQNYTWLPIGSHDKKTGTIIISNNTNIPWYLNNKKIDANKKNVSVSIDTPHIYTYLNSPEKTQQSSLGTWFATQPAYDQEVYSINKDNKEFVLTDESINKKISAQPSIITNIANIV